MDYIPLIRPDSTMVCWAKAAEIVNETKPSKIQPSELACPAMPPLRGTATALGYDEVSETGRYKFTVISYYVIERTPGPRLISNIVGIYIHRRISGTSHTLQENKKSILVTGVNVPHAEMHANAQATIAGILWLHFLSKSKETKVIRRKHRGYPESRRSYYEAVAVSAHSRGFG